MARVSTDPDDAAGVDDIQLPARRFPHEVVAFSAGIDPDLGNSLLLKLGEQRHRDVGLHVHGGHVNRHGHVQNRRVGRNSFDGAFVRIDRKNGVALGSERSQRLVAELLSIARRADNGDGLCHTRIIAGTLQSLPFDKIALVRRPVLTLLLLCALTFFLGLGRPAITDSDEAFYAEASREMLESGDWLTPRFNYEDRWQKPVLFYWVTAATYRITGPTEWAARVWSALAGVGLVMLTWSAGRTMTPRADAGWLAGAIVATCFGYFAMARAALPDLPLAFCITLCVWAAIRGAEHGARWWALAGLGAGLGFLLKGPVALVIPALVLLPIAWRERSRLTVRPSGVAVAVVVFAIVGLPWYGAMLVEHGPAYAQSFFVGDNFERFATDRFNDPRPLWFYLPVVLGGMLPWSAYLVTLGVRPTKELLQRTRRLTDQEWRLLIWAGLPLLFFTMSIGKQPRYILPVLPPLAILLAATLATHIASSTDRTRAQTGLIAATWTTAVLLGLIAFLFVRMQTILISA